MKCVKLRIRCANVRHSRNGVFSAPRIAIRRRRTRNHEIRSLLWLPRIVKWWRVLAVSALSMGPSATYRVTVDQRLVDVVIDENVVGFEVGSLRCRSTAFRADRTMAIRNLLSGVGYMRCCCDSEGRETHGACDNVLDCSCSARSTERVADVAFLVARCVSLQENGATCLDRNRFYSSRCDSRPKEFELAKISILTEPILPQRRKCKRTLWCAWCA